MYELATNMYPMAAIMPSIIYLLLGGGFFGAFLIWVATKVFGH